MISIKIKLIFFAIIPVLFYSCNHSLQNEGCKVDYDEPEFPASADSGKWEQVSHEINVTFGSTNIRYGKYDVPDEVLTKEWSGSAWKGERVNAQILIWSGGTLPCTSCNPSDFLNKEGYKIDAKSLNVSFVRYVITDEYGKKGAGARNAADYDSSLVADVLDPLQVMDIEARTVRAVWIAINVPDTVAAGDYSGEIAVKANGKKDMKLKINLEVLDKTLPNPSQWTFHLDLWQNPFAVARFNKVKLWSKEHFKLLRPLMSMLANAGQKCITASITDKPWGGQTYDPFASLIKWEKTKDGTWSYDYKLFDDWIEFAMSCGIKEQINGYSMIPWHDRIAYYDELQHKDTVVTARSGTELYRELWTPFLMQFVNHLKEKGWLGKTVIAMDERKPEDMRKLITFLQSVAPSLKIALAGGFHPEISNSIYDLCVYKKNKVSAKDLAQRQGSGFKTTYYVCSSPHHPNTFTFSPPSETTYLGWYAAAMGFDGFLRWAYNSWPENPLLDSRFRRWPAGETFLVYPGARSSVRFEKLREGIQDYEKIRILRSEPEKEGTEKAKQRLNELDEYLSAFRLKSLGHTPAGELVEEGKKLLEKLSKN